MTDRRLWQVVELLFLAIVCVATSLVVSLMVGGSSLVESLVTVKELVWPTSH